MADMIETQDKYRTCDDPGVAEMSWVNAKGIGIESPRHTTNGALSQLREWMLEDAKNRWDYYVAFTATVLNDVPISVIARQQNVSRSTVRRRNDHVRDVLSGLLVGQS